jgi:phosphodiesterase/alkaline phosphatase D-like protein
MSARKTSRRIALIGMAILGTVGTQLAVTAGPAAAFLGYGEPTFFGAAGSGNGQFSGPAGIAFDESSGDVYIVDQENNRVQRFDAEGNYLSQFNGSDNPSFPGGLLSPTWIAVDDSASESKGDTYVIDSGHNVVDKFSSVGAFVLELKGFASSVIGVAADDAGHVWIVESNKSVQEFSGAVANTLMGSVTPAFERSPGIAVDSQENLYLLRGEPNAAKFDKNGATVVAQLTTCGCGTALAIDPGTNGLFIDEGGGIVRYGPFAEPYVIAPNGELRGAPIETLEGVSSSKGIVVNGLTHTVYASQQAADTVAIFKRVLLPDVTTGSASEIHRTSAKLEGEVNPDGQEVTTCEFEYGTSEAYGQTVPCATAPGSGTSAVPVSATALNLTQETTYHYRLVAGNSNRVRPNPGADRTFTTSPAVEKLETLEATGIQGTGATLNGSFEANGFDTHYLFEYGITEAYGASTATADGGSAAGETTVSTGVSGLKPDQVYDYRIVAENTFGKTNAMNRTFRTAVLPPQISGSPTAEFVTAQTAVLGASLNPEHTSTRYHFEYGACPLTSGANVQSTPDETSAVYGVIGTSAEIVGLAPSTTYCYRLVANNEFEDEGKTLGGKGEGTEGTFTTGPAAIPGAETGAYGAVTPTSAIISGTAEPNGVPTSYAFELGVYNGASTQYGVVSSGSAGASNVPVPVSLTLTGLQPGTTYAYRVTVSSGYIITNASHTLQGATVTFTTPGIPRILTIPPLLAQLPLPPIAFPNEPAKVTPKPLTRAQQLKNALKVCRKKSKRQRSSCEGSARKKYGPKPKPKKKK